MTYNPSPKLTLIPQQRAGQSCTWQESHLPTRISIQIFLLISKCKLLWVLLLNLCIRHLLAHALQGATPAYTGRLTHTAPPKRGRQQSRTPVFHYVPSTAPSPFMSCNWLVRVSRTGRVRATAEKTWLLYHKLPLSSTAVGNLKVKNSRQEKRNRKQGRRGNWPCGIPAEGIKGYRGRGKKEMPTFVLKDKESQEKNWKGLLQTSWPNDVSRN